MAEDYEVLRKLWDGRIPILIFLDETEFPNRPVRPFCAMVRRIGYFPLILPQVLEFFGIDEVSFSPWLQYNGKPIKHYPIGVLFDILKIDRLLPWSITLKTKDFPNEIIHCSGNALQMCFMQSIKEADQLKHDSKIINSMKPDEHIQLWNGVLHDRYDEYWIVNRKLMENSDQNPLLHVPIRIYRGDERYYQPLISPQDNDGQLITIEKAIRQYFFDDKIIPLSFNILLPLETPILWMCQNFTYADNFIHIVVTTKSS
ncbi:unnamed protein product [Dracunculus medinensis]|uniref:Autophagy protein 5 n=1 Tax=Dracunculus medinensis TaxID=318479 RepID=A0A0N4U4C6_DRAME|nr:unnamed protein product [Dracunculus medinensis]